MTTALAPLFAGHETTSLDGSDKARLDLRFIFRAVIVPFAFTRLLLLCAACYGFYRIPAARAFDWKGPSASNLLNMWSRFDGVWYLSIARNGYHLIPNQMSNVAFAPLYPMLMQFFGLLGGGSDIAFLIAGIAISNIALIVGIIYMMALLMLDGHDRITAARAAWFILIFPTSFFLSAVYPMSLFIALGAAAFYHARKKHWKAVGLLAGLAGLSRPDGVLLSVGLAVEYLLQYGFSLRREASALVCGPMATLSWLVFQWQRFGDPLAFVTVQKQWSSCPFSTVWHSSHAVVQLGPTALFVVLAMAAVFKLRGSYSAFFILMFALMLNAGRFWSITRFIIVLFPAFMMLGIIARRWGLAGAVYTLICGPLSMILMMRFALNLWVA